MAKSHCKALLAIFLVAIIARLIFHFAVYVPFADRFNWAHHPGQFNWYSDDNYDEIARSLLSGKGFTKSGADPDITRTPVYPLVLLTQFYLFGDGYYVNLIINILYQSLVCVILYYLTLKMFQERKLSILSSLIWALYPLPMLQAMGPHTEAIYELLLICFAYCFYQFYEGEKRKYLVYSSVLLVLATLTRPISILFPAYFMLLTLLFSATSFVNRLKHILLLCLIFVVGTAPWVFRNYKVTGDILPLVTYNRYYQAKADNRATDENSKWLGFRASLKYEIKTPLLFLKNTLKRLVKFWYYGNSTPVRIVNATLQFPFLAVSIVGIWLARKRGVIIFPVLSIVGYFWMAYAALHAISRYSFPMTALLCPFVAVGLNRMFIKLRNRLI